MSLMSSSDLAHLQPAKRPLPLVLLPRPVRPPPLFSCCSHSPSHLHHLAAAPPRPQTFEPGRAYACTYSAHTPYSQRRSRLQTSCGRPSSPAQSHPGPAATTDFLGSASVVVVARVAATALHLTCTAQPSASNPAIRQNPGSHRSSLLPELRHTLVV